MAPNFERRTQSLGGYGVAGRVEVDQALRAYLLHVYNIMASGLLLSGIIAVLVAESPALTQTVNGSGLGMLIRIAPLGILLAMSFGINKMSAATVSILYWAFVATMGVGLSGIFYVYHLGSILQLFFVTAAMFGAMSLYGYTTQRDLTHFGSFLFMGLIGIVIAMVVNLFFHSAGLGFIISVLGVLIFTGLTAYDTQRIKREFHEGNPAEVTSKMATMSAVSLYLNFINLFLLLLSLVGDRR